MPVASIPQFSPIPAPDWLTNMGSLGDEPLYELASHSIVFKSSTDAAAAIAAKTHLNLAGANLTMFEPKAPAATPTLVSIAPTAATAGDADTTVTLTGTNFTANTVATIDTADAATTFISATKVSVIVPAAKLAAAGTVTIGVKGIATTKTITVT